MIINIRPLHQKESVSIESSPDENISIIKEKLKGILDIETDRQTLIFKGKVLKNDDRLCDHGFDESSFLVLLVTKGALSKKPEPSVNFSGIEENSGGSCETVNETVVNSFVSMGFDRNNILKALKAASNHPDVAAEYLFSGSMDKGSGDSHNEMVENLGFLRHDPQFLQLKAILKQNPHYLEPLMQHIGNSNPRLLEIINDNKEEFVSLLDEALEEDYEVQDGDLFEFSMNTNAEGDVSCEEGQDDADSCPGVDDRSQLIQITHEEKESIDRLMALGFERSRVLEAFLACDKNEDLAANFLVDHINDE